MTNSKVKPADVAVDSLVKALDELESSGRIIKWVKDWVSTDPQNAGSGAKYHGFNTLRCALHNAIGGYDENLFLTQSGARSAGGTIIPEQYANSVVLVRPNIREVIDPDTGEKVSKYIGWIYFRAWNIAQTADVNRDKLKVEAVVAKGAKRKPNADKTISKTGAIITHGGNVAAYSPKKDAVNLPKTEHFKSTEGYYATAFHELVHWTGHESRENRFTADGFCTENYAREELTAEFGSFALCAVHGINASEENALAYIQGWKKRIKSEPSGAVVTSVSHAQKAVRRILGIKEV